MLLLSIVLSNAVLSMGVAVLSMDVLVLSMDVESISGAIDGWFDA